MSKYKIGSVPGSIVIVCEICDIPLAHSKESYRAHMKQFHSLESKASHIVEATKIVPLKTSKRTRMQIVADAEKIWGAAIIVPATADVILVPRAIVQIDTFAQAYIKQFKSLAMKGVK